MASEKPINAHKKKKGSNKNPKKMPLGPNRPKMKKKEEKKKNNKGSKGAKNKLAVSMNLPASEQLSFFFNRLEASTSTKLSSIELEPIKDTCILELSHGLDQDADSLFKHMKGAFGTSWKEDLCDGKLLEGKIDPGSPAILVVSTSALRSLELLRGLRPLTKECPPAKLFAKHMKVEEQVSLLKSRVNIASGTPSRIKKLIDIDALGLSRLAVIVLDMHTDVKGYSLLTLPQVRDEFWDLYKTHFHQRLIQNNLRICLYGPISSDAAEVKNEALDNDQ